MGADDGEKIKELAVIESVLGAGNISEEEMAIKRERMLELARGTGTAGDYARWLLERQKK